MSVVDAPPGRDFAGPAVGEFRLRPGPKRLARAVFLMCLVDAAATFALARGMPSYAFGSTGLFVLPLVCISIAGVGLAVRSAVVRIDAGGIQWGWGALGFRIGPSRIQALHYYPRGLAVVRKGGAPWYLARHDWERFDEVPKACEDAGLPVERRPGRAPLRAQMQAYGVVLDGLMVLTLFGSGVLVAFAALQSG